MSVFLETMLDQVLFMGSVLDISQLRARVKRYFQFGSCPADEFPEQMREALFPKLNFPPGSNES